MQNANGLHFDFCILNYPCGTSLSPSLFLSSLAFRTAFPITSSFHPSVHVFGCLSDRAH